MDEEVNRDENGEADGMNLEVLYVKTYYTSVVCAGIEAHQGINVWLNVGIVLAICFTILTTVICMINVVHKKCGKQQEAALRADLLRSTH